MLGINEEYEHFDTDIIIHINTIFMTLTQLGIGPVNGFIIKDKTTVWSDFLGDAIRAEATKSYVYLKVRLLFDPPANSFLVEAIKNQATELEWRLNIQTVGGDKDAE